MSRARASRRMALSSKRLFLPSGVLITICTRPPRISSPMCGVPSPTFGTLAAARPRSFRKRAVPPVASST